MWMNETVMEGFIRVSVLLFLAYVVSTFLGCANIPSGHQPSSRAIPISGIHDVTGKWEGLLEETPSPPPLRYGGDWITLTITGSGAGRADAFEFSSYRTIGVFMGSGPLTLADGKLTSESEKGHATYTLYEIKGTPTLVVEAEDRKGIRYHAELS